MMRKALVASIGMAAMLALAACSGDGKVSQSVHDAALADGEGLRSDLADVRSDLAEAKADLEAARARLREADDNYVLAEQRARAAQQAAVAAQRAYENGTLTRTQLEKARADAVAARDAADAARLAADAARTAATAQSAVLQSRVNLMTQDGDLPAGHRGITAQTPDLTLNPGESKIIGNVRFACDADSPDAAACTVAFVLDDDSNVQFRRNVVLVTATLISDPLAERLLIATTNTSTTGAVSAYAYPEDGGDNSTGKLTTYIREMGTSNAYTVTVSVDGDPLGGADRNKNLYRFYAGKTDDRPDGHAELTALTDLKVEASTGLVTGWSLASLDGVDGVRTVTAFGAGNSELPEGERWTKSWMVEDGALPGGRVIDLDAYTNRKRTTTTGTTDAAAFAAAFPDAVDRTAVTGALSDDGYQLVSGAANGAIGTAPDGDPDDKIPARFAYQLEIDAESDQTVSTGVDESKRIRVSDIPSGQTVAANQYQLSALSTTSGGTPAWFYGIPGRVVCGGTPTDCGDTIIARPDRDQGGDPPGFYFYRNSAAGATGGLRFHANAGEHEFYVPDADWVSIGVWAVRPAAGAMVADVQMGAFVHGGQPWDFGNGTTGVTNAHRAAAGKVDYVGDAVGRYAEQDGDAAAVTGRFTATTNLTFDLAWDDTAASDTDSGGLSGRITEFRLDGKDDAENWRLTLANTNAEQLFRSAPLLSGTCGANTGVSIGGTGTCGSAGILAGVADGTVMQGRLNARAFGPAYVAGTATTHTPTAIAGTFLAEPGVVRSNHDLSLVGAFLAGRKPAAATE